MSQDMKKQIRKARLTAEAMVDRVVAMMLSSDCDAGWTGAHPLGTFHNLKGFCPDGSGFSGFSKVWEQARILQDWPQRHKDARDRLAKLKDSHREAVLLDRLARNLVRRTEQGELMRWTDGEIAFTLQLTPANFRQRVCRGYRRLILLSAPELRR